jgi:hypothetical protein
MCRSSVIVLVASLALAAGSTGAASPTARPRLQALAFRPYERVKLILSADVAAGKTLKASGTGRFTTRFRTVTVGRCEGFVLQALGSRGSRATLERLTPDCIEP